MRLSPWAASLVLGALVGACDAALGDGRADAGSRTDGGATLDARTDAAATSPDGAIVEGDAAAADPRAFLHADVWSIFWNDRTRCGAERTFLEICERREEADCSLYRRAWEACDPGRVIYGQVGPEQQGERLCSRGPEPDVGGCDARAYDFDRLRFRFYGAEWAGNWPVSTLKIFEAGATDPSAWAGDALVALSSHPGARQASMDGVANHGLAGAAPPCAMAHGETSGDAAYLEPFGGFAWIEVPTDRAVLVVAMAATNFADDPFTGCRRGAATSERWVTSPPGATLGCVYAIEQRFEPGAHYVFRYGRIERLTERAPPAEIVAGFALPEIAIDVRDASSCPPP